MQEQQESQFLVTDAVTKYNDFIFVQSDINITDMPLESTNMTIPPFITGAINIVVQTNHMLESIRYIAKQDDYIKNTDVRLFNDNCCDLGGINGTVINQSSQKTMLQSIQLQLTSTSRSMITNVIIIESYLLMNKCIIQQSNEANVRDDFNRFIDKNKDNKIVVKVYSNFVGNPTGISVNEGVSYYKSNSCDGVIAFGGGIKSLVIKEKVSPQLAASIIAEGIGISAPTSAEFTTPKGILLEQK